MSEGREQVWWLIVGGAPRSGTTALGEALSQSSDIALFHEYLSHKFFNALESFFDEEDRMSLYPSFRIHSKMMPTREKQSKEVVLNMYASVFPEKKKPRYIGTKSPSYEAFPEPNYPDWIKPRIIHITRNPFDVTLSSLKKDMNISKEIQGNATMNDLEDRLYRWVHAWNYAIEHADDDNFLHIFYDDLLQNPQGEQQRVRDFLEGVEDFDFSMFKPTQTKSVEERYSGADMQEYLSVIKGVAPIADWGTYSKERFANRQKIGFPLRRGKKIDLTVRTRDWDFYVTSGFYFAEKEGAWTRGKKANLLFAPLGFIDAPLEVAFEVTYAANDDDKARDIEVFLDGKSLFRAEIDFRSRGGEPATFRFTDPDFKYVPLHTCALTFLVHEPVSVNDQGGGRRRKKRNGQEDNEARKLGIMIKTISFLQRSSEPETPRTEQLAEVPAEAQTQEPDQVAERKPDDTATTESP